MSDRDFELTRYSLLTDMWIHHNQIQLQWPSLIIGSALVVISIVVPGNLEALMNVTAWGQDGEARLIGLPLFLIGLVNLIMIYTMERSRSIMTIIEDEVSVIEEKYLDKKLRKTIPKLNGFSGPGVMKKYMFYFLALPFTLEGLFVMAGIIPGAIVGISIMVIWIYARKLMGSRIFV